MVKIRRRRIDALCLLMLRQDVSMSRGNVRKLPSSCLPIELSDDNSKVLTSSITSISTAGGIVVSCLELIEIIDIVAVHTIEHQQLKAIIHPRSRTTIDIDMQSSDIRLKSEV